MKFELDIEATVQAAITAALSPAVLEEKVGKLVADTVDEVLKAQFRWHGEFGKAVAAAVKTVVPHEITIDGAARFDHVLKAAIERRLAAFGDERMAQSLGPMLDKLLETPPAEIKLSQLVHDAKEDWADHHRRDGGQQMTVIVDEVTYGSRWIYMDPREGRSKGECQVRIGVTESNGRMFGLKIDGKEVGKTLFAGEFYEFERDLFALFTRAAKLVVDVESFDDGELYYPESSED